MSLKDLRQKQQERREKWLLNHVPMSKAKKIAFVVYYIVMFALVYLLWNNITDLMLIMLIYIVLLFCLLMASNRMASTGEYSGSSYIRAMNPEQHPKTVLTIRGFLLLLLPAAFDLILSFVVSSMRS